MKKNLKFLIAAFLLLPTIILLSGCMTTKVDISFAELTLEQETYNYTGHEITPEVTVTHEEKILVLDEHYTVSYINNKDIGTATVTINGISKYKGTKSINFKITQAPLTDIFATPYQEMFDGTNKTVNFSGLQSGDTVLYSLAIDGDFTLSHPEVKNVGEHTIYFKVQRANHIDFVSSTKINILPATQNLAWQGITKQEDKDFFEFSKNYDGEQVAFSFTGQAAGSEAFYSTDNKESFTKDFPTIKNAGNYTVFVRVLNSNYHAVEIEARIEIYVVSGLNATFSNLEQTYNGGEKTFVLNTLNEGSTIKYALENNGEYNLIDLPKFTNAGIYNIYYQISKQNYETVVGQITFTIKKATPSLYSTAATDITYGQKVGDSVILYTSATAGVASWITPEEKPNASDETQPFYFTFTPNNPNYTSLSYKVFVKVNKATPNVLFDYSKHNLYKDSGTPNMWLLPENQVDGIISFDQDIVVIGTNDYSWTFTPNNENYNIVTGFITLTVLNHEIEDVWIINFPFKFTYMAFEEFDATGMEVAYRVTDGIDTWDEYTTEFDKVIYQDSERNHFLAGDDYILVVFAGFDIMIDGLFVEKLFPEISVEYTGPQYYTPNMMLDQSYFTITSSITGTIEFYSSYLNEYENNVYYTFTPDDTDNYETTDGHVEFYLEREASITELKVNDEIIELEVYDNNYYFLENHEDIEIILNFDINKFRVVLEYYTSNDVVSLDLEPNVAYMLDSKIRSIMFETYMIDGEPYDNYYLDFVRSETIKGVYIENEKGETFNTYKDINYNQEIDGFNFYYYEAAVITSFLYEVDDRYNVVVLKDGEVFEINKLQIGTNYLTLAVYDEFDEFVEEKDFVLTYYPEVIFNNINLSFDEEDFKQGYVFLNQNEDNYLSIVLDLDKQEQGRIYSSNEDLVLTIYNNKNQLVEEPFELELPLKPIKLKALAVYKEIYKFEIVIYVQQEANEYLEYIYRAPYAYLDGKEYMFYRNFDNIYFNGYDNKIPVTYSTFEVYENLNFDLFGEAYSNGISITKYFEQETERIFLNVYEYGQLVRVAEVVVNKYGKIDSNTTVFYDHYAIMPSFENILQNGSVKVSVGDEIYFYTENEIAILEIISEDNVDINFENNSVAFYTSGEYQVTIKITASDGVTEEAYTITFIVAEIEPFVVIELLNGETYTLKLDMMTMSFGDFNLIDADETIAYAYAALDINQMNLYMQNGEFFARFLSINQMGSVIIETEMFANPKDAKLEQVVYNDLIYYQFMYQFEIDEETIYIAAMFTFTELQEVAIIGYNYHDEESNLVTVQEVLKFDTANKKLVGTVAPYYIGEESNSAYALDLSSKIQLDENNQSTFAFTAFESSTIILFDEEFMPASALNNVTDEEVTLLFTENLGLKAAILYLYMLPIESLEELNPEALDLSLMFMLIILA